MNKVYQAVRERVAEIVRDIRQSGFKNHTANSFADQILSIRLNLEYDPEGRYAVKVVDLKAELPEDCQFCEHHHCYYDQACSCDLTTLVTTCTHGIPRDCPLKKVFARIVEE